jgi:hypothetical protein
MRLAIAKTAWAGFEIEPFFENRKPATTSAKAERSGLPMVGPHGWKTAPGG